MQPDPPIVLIVDAHEDSLAMYAIGLMALGFQPVAAKDAEEGFGLACARHPEVVVVDLIIPLTSGLDLIHRLRHDPRTKDVPIIVITGHPRAATFVHAREADRFLFKPCAPGTLAIAICDLLPNERSRSSWSIDAAPI
jgi:DNA-binding response OmpR family regulator